MIFYPEERIAIFIDGANLYSAARGLAFDIDYKRLLELFRSKGRLIRAFYYTALLEDQEYSPIRPLVDWLDYNGYTMVTKPTKEFTDAMGRRRIKGNMDIELAIDMLEMAEHIDHAVLFSGDGDFRRLVEAVQRRGVRVSVVSTIRSTPPMVSDDLRRQADSFIELQELAPSITPQPPFRATRSRRGPTSANGPSRSRPRDWRRCVALPDRDCPLCPRLAAFRAAQRQAHPDWFNAPVPSFGDDCPTLLIVGLAPGLQGRQPHRPAVHRRFRRRPTVPHAAAVGFAEGSYGADPQDGLQLVGARIINAVRCVPPQNRPEPAEIAACGRFLAAELTAVPGVKAILALGAIAHNAVLAAKGLRRAAYPFAHGAAHELPDGILLADSYHCSRLNTNTGRLTEAMFESVIAGLAERLRH